MWRLCDYSGRLTLSLPRVINFPLQPHQKYNITQYKERVLYVTSVDRISAVSIELDLAHFPESVGGDQATLLTLALFQMLTRITTHHTLPTVSKHYHM